MKKFAQGMLLATLAISPAVIACTEDGKQGIVEENSLRIPVNAKRLGGISEKQFNDIIDQVEALYTPLAKEQGGELNIERNWDDGTVNAYAQRFGSTWQVSMFGGLARHDTITEDGFRLVICHEIGHHMGGAPKKVSWWSNPWASNEGQADYFATLKCLRKVWLNDDNAKIIADMEVPVKLAESCEKAWGSSADYSLCVRGGMAGDSVARLFAALRGGQEPAKFETPDSAQVTTTNDSHPATQCRLDTYFQGALCEKSHTEDVVNSSEVTGTCHGSTGHSVGLRPRCWFKPSAQ